MARLEWNHYPTEEEIREALSNIPAWPGSDKTLADYQAHIVPIKQSRKRRDGQWESTWRLYTTVDGRIVMWQDAHLNCEEPPREELTDLSLQVLPDERAFILARIKITSPIFGEREDAAIADLQAQAGPDRDKPWENAITSARGRVLGAFGFGLIPSQGLASADEMRQVLGEEAETEAEVVPMPQSPPKPQTQPKAKPRNKPQPNKSQDEPPSSPLPGADKVMSGILKNHNLGDEEGNAMVEVFAAEQGVSTDYTTWPAKTFTAFAGWLARQLQ